ncbi:hypothetical protein G5I_12178 [Acromyrmex echinatior]|uniref:Uncharacterized protein n=1 Tax=Acromyrmex echinatior TaxID=103372 RepID=F4X1L6_ACREC|nr:hypothetical protein G5I_12178 [Acromyrmex echinatior]
MELENCNAHGDQENTGPNTPQHDNDPSGNKKWYRQASQSFLRLNLGNLGADDSKAHLRCCVAEAFARLFVLTF